MFSAKLIEKARTGYPLLFAIFPIVSITARNTDFIYWRDPALAAAFVMALTAAVGAVMRLVVRQPEKRALITLAFVVFFWGSAPAVDALRNTLDIQGMFSPLQIALAGAPILALAMAPLIWLWRTQRSFAGLTVFLAVTSVLALALPLAGLAYKFSQRSAFEPEGIEPLSAAGDSDPAQLPDIVLIIADMYGRHDMIQKYYDYDNSGFLEALEGRGFYIAKEAYANYNFTRSAVPSLLNFMYLKDIAPVHGGTVPFPALVQDNRIVHYLRNRGYEFVAFATGTELTEFRSADRYLSPRRVMSDFTNVIINKSALRFAVNRIRSRKEHKLGRRYLVHDLHRNRILHTFDQLKSLERNGKPLFVFAHVMFPHDPFVFDAEGNAVYPETRYRAVSFPSWETPNPEEYYHGYRNHLQAINRMLLETIDAIKARAPETIIILMGDHGPRSNKLKGHPGGTWRDYLDEEMGILNALHLPGIDQESVLYPKISPVNTFRVILNEYFGEHFELLEDQSHFVLWGEEEVYDVTQDLAIFANRPENLEEANGMQPPRQRRSDQR